MRKNIGRYLLLGILIPLLAIHPLMADSIDWTGGAGNYSDPTKWSPRAPSPGDDVTTSIPA